MNAIRRRREVGLGGRSRSRQVLLLSGLVALVAGACFDELWAAGPTTQMSRPPGAVVVRWRFDAGKGLQASPAADEKRIYVADVAGVVTAVLRASQAAEWTSAGSAEVSAGLLVVGGRVIVCDEDGLVRALGTEDGKEAWRFAAKQKIVARPAEAKGVIFAGSYDEHVYALAAEDGKLLWQQKTGAQVHAAPAVADDLVLVAGCDGQVRAFDIGSGEQRWAFDAGEPMGASCRVQEGVVYVGTLKGERLALDLKTGQLRWRNNDNQTRGEAIMAAATFHRDWVSFMTQGGVNASHTSSDGKWRASSRLSGRFSSDGVRWNDIVWYASEDGKLHGPMSKGGAAAFTAGGGIKASPVVVGEDLLVVDESGMLWALAAAK
jgi:outer membrane protein assembly factor BamB